MHIIQMIQRIWDLLNLKVLKAEHYLFGYQFQKKMKFGGAGHLDFYKAYGQLWNINL